MNIYQEAGSVAQREVIEKEFKEGISSKVTKIDSIDAGSIFFFCKHTGGWF